MGGEHYPHAVAKASAFNLMFWLGGGRSGSGVGLATGVGDLVVFGVTERKMRGDVQVFR
jgi:hypothetical protein